VCRRVDWARRPVSTFREWLMMEARAAAQARRHQRPEAIVGLGMAPPA
jgi:hypothetical protein